MKRTLSGYSAYRIRTKFQPMRMTTNMMAIAAKVATSSDVTWRTPGTRYDSSPGWHVANRGIEAALLSMAGFVDFGDWVEVVVVVARYVEREEVVNVVVVAVATGPGMEVR